MNLEKAHRKGLYQQKHSRPSVEDSTQNKQLLSASTEEASVPLFHAVLYHKLLFNLKEL